MSKHSVSEEAPSACGWYISYLYRKSDVSLTLQLKQLGLSPAQSIMLVGIYRNEGVNQQTLCEIVSAQPSVASRALRELEDNGYIVKKKDEQNRRNYNLSLTPAGRDLAEKSLAAQEKYWNHLLTVFTPEETAALNQLLRRMQQKAAQD